MSEALRNFTVTVGDLVRSRKIPARKDVSHRIQSAMRRINREFHNEFYAPLILTRGIDEFSGVLKRSGVSYRICRLLNDEVRPHAFRFAIVRGILDIADLGPRGGLLRTYQAVH